MEPCSRAGQGAVGSEPRAEEGRCRPRRRGSAGHSPLSPLPALSFKMILMVQNV